MLHNTYPISRNPLVQGQAQNSRMRRRWSSQLRDERPITGLDRKKTGIEKGKSLNRSSYVSLSECYLPFPRSSDNMSCFWKEDSFCIWVLLGHETESVLHKIGETKSGSTWKQERSNSMCCERIKNGKLLFLPNLTLTSSRIESIKGTQLHIHMSKLLL